MNRAWLTILLLFVGFAAGFSGIIKDGTPSAFSNGTNILVRWLSEDESGIAGYSIERKAGIDGPFVLLTSPPLPAKGNNFSYEYIDNTAFKVTDTFYQYRITPVFADGKTAAPYYVSVSHSVNSVRRTWGSIKAMFR